jgi:hypothetical protein
MISVATVTNKTEPRIITNIFNNFKRQLYPSKELILVINSNEDVIKYNTVANEMDILNYHIYTLKPTITLGECLNYSIREMNGIYWAKMDDDDYYGEKYLVEAHYSLITNKTDLVGKKSVRLYDEDTSTMYNLNQSKNKFVTFVRGPTFFCHKSLFSKHIIFHHLNHGEDTKLLKDLIKHCKKIYASSDENFIYIRNTGLNQSSTTPLYKYIGSKYNIIKY